MEQVVDYTDKILKLSRIYQTISHSRGYWDETKVIPAKFIKKRN